MSNSQEQRHHMHPLTVGVIVFASMWIGAQSTEANPKTVEANSRICTLIAKALTHKVNGPLPLYVHSINGGGRALIYENVDIDGDQIPDVVRQDCGSPSDGTCSLYVTLSKGGSYEVLESPFRLISFHSKYYVLVGDLYSKKSKHRRLYALTARGAHLVCNSF